MWLFFCYVCGYNYLVRLGAILSNNNVDIVF